MDKVQESNDSSGIKLFGATISLLKERSSSQAKNDQTHKPKQLDNNNNNDQTVELKRPDKIIPCPRCKSMATKFCYFNNYNVNQPRHFCKGCQRYWTAGGALRNVPVGAGRRKIKQSYRGLSEGYLFDHGSGVQQLDFDAVVEEWQVSEHGGFQHLYPVVKKRRCASTNDIVNDL